MEHPWILLGNLLLEYTWRKFAKEIKMNIVIFPHKGMVIFCEDQMFQST